MSYPYTVLIIGIGALGRRHLEACLNLPAEQYAISVVEPNDKSWAVAEASVVAAGKKVERVRTISELAVKSYDVAVIVTCADKLFAVLQQILNHTPIKAIVLEKVLFQDLREYALAADLLVAKGVPAWVNCPRRMWPGYVVLKDRYGDKIIACEQTGSGWDIGCEGIHYLDLFDFLSGSDSVHVEAFTLHTAPEPAKRSGMVHVYGCCHGKLRTSDRDVSFSINAHKGEGAELITLLLNDGAKLEIVEVETGGKTEMTVTHTDVDGISTSEVFPILFQSRLTNGVVENVIKHGDSGLTSFAKSHLLHEAMLSPLHDSLKAFLPDLAAGCCPIT